MNNGGIKWFIVANKPVQATLLVFGDQEYFEHDGDIRSAYCGAFETKAAALLQIAAEARKSVQALQRTANEALERMERQREIESNALREAAALLRKEQP
jgi:hypothetical protein